MSEGRLRIPAMTVALLFLFIGVMALVTILGDPYQMDFVSYWAAAQLTVAGNPAGAYDVALHRATELGAIPLHGALPFAYPPCFLLPLAPFGLLSYPVAAFAWVLLTFAFYCATPGVSAFLGSNVYFKVSKWATPLDCEPACSLPWTACEGSAAGTDHSGHGF